MSWGSRRLAGRLLMVCTSRGQVAQIERVSLLWYPPVRVQARAIVCEEDNATDCLGFDVHTLKDV